MCLYFCKDILICAPLKKASQVWKGTRNVHFGVKYFFKESQFTSFWMIVTRIISNLNVLKKFQFSEFYLCMQSL